MNASAITMRQPTAADGAAVRALVEACGTLEPNTTYAYLLLCTHFADTCVVAERDGELVGMVLAYRPPTRPTSVFVWQVGVHDSARGQGLGGRLLEATVAAPGCEGVTHLEATVAPSNTASQRLFEGFARRASVPCDVTTGFTAADFGAGHEAEPLYRIGPLRRTS